MTRVVVVGGDAAGMSAASKAKRTRPDIEVTVLEESDWSSYSACGLPYYIAGEVAQLNDLVARSATEFRSQGIDLRLGHRAIAVDPARGSVSVRNREGHDEQFGYDRLVLATGARAKRLGVPGEDLRGVFSLRSPSDAAQLNGWITDQDVREALIIGGGYVGLEMTDAFLARGMKVTLVQGPTQLLPALDEDLAILVQQELVRRGVRVLLDARVGSIEGNANTVTAVRVGDETIRAQLVLVAAGITPNAQLAETASVELGATGAIRVDDRQRTSADGVFAAGDCAEAFHHGRRSPAWVPLGTTANKQGRVAGENAAGGDARFDGIFGTGITRVCGLEIAVTGLSLRHAQAIGIAAIANTVKGRSAANYMPEAEPLWVRLVADAQTGRLLGGQIVGGSGAKRIDTIATALYAGLSVDDLSRLDLAYVPPLAPVWDPVLVAAQELGKLL